MILAALIKQLSNVTNENQKHDFAIIHRLFIVVIVNRSNQSKFPI